MKKLLNPLALIFTLGLWMGCGPMNQRPTPESAPAGSSQIADSPANPSDSGHFLISQSPIINPTDNPDEYEEVEVNAEDATSEAQPEEQPEEQPETPKDATPPAKKELVLNKGQNILRLFIYNGIQPGNKDALDELVPLSHEAKVTVEYSRVKSKLRRVHRTTAVKDPKDPAAGFVAVLHIRKEGAWNIRVTIVDGTKKDTHVIKASAKF